MREAIVYYVGAALLALCLFFGTGCGTDPANVPYPVPGPTVTALPAPAASPTAQDAINAIVASENTYRETLGETFLTNGLQCVLYTITGGAYINATSITGASQSPVLTGVTQVATFLFADVFNQQDSSVTTGLNVLPAPLFSNPTYQNLIKLTCQGDIVITDDGYYDFELSTDDGGDLYIDGSRLVDTDGEHAILTRDGTKNLRSGVHTFRLDFAQTGAGNQALILMMNGSLIPGAYYFH